MEKYISDTIWKKTLEIRQEPEVQQELSGEEKGQCTLEKNRNRKQNKL